MSAAVFVNKCVNRRVIQEKCWVRVVHGGAGVSMWLFYRGVLAQDVLFAPAEVYSPDDPQVCVVIATLNLDIVRLLSKRAVRFNKTGTSCVLGTTLGLSLGVCAG